MAKLIMEIETDNDAFGEDRYGEIKRIIDSNLEKIKLTPLVHLFDLNGNKVGKMQYIYGEFE